MNKLPNSAATPRFQLVRARDIKPRPIDWQIRSMFERGGLVLYFGDPATSKTFLALDHALCIASGIEWKCRPVKRGPVAYICGEGQNGIGRRICAWCIRHDIALENVDLHVSTMPAAMTEQESLIEVMRAIDSMPAPPTLVILDTLARNFGPGDENSSEHMTNFVRGCDELRAAYGCTVLIIHHSGHAAKDRARGSTALRGALDAEFRLSRDPSGVITVDCTKAKDWEPPEPMAFKLRAVEIGIESDDGNPATSAVLEPCDLPTRHTEPIGKRQIQGLDILDRLHLAQRERLEAGGHPDQNRAVLVSDWLRAMEAEGIPKRTAQDVKNKLRDRTQIVIENGRVRRSEEP